MSMFLVHLTQNAFVYTLYISAFAVKYSFDDFNNFHYNRKDNKGNCVQLQGTVNSFLGKEGLDELQSSLHPRRWYWP